MNLLKGMLVALAAAALAACNEDNAPAEPAGFTASVSTVVNQPSETAEASDPLPLQSVMARSSETAEPVPVSF